MPRVLLGFAIVAGVAPLTPRALDATMLVKLVLVTAVVVALLSWAFAGAVTHHRLTFVSGWAARGVMLFAAFVAGAVLWSSYPALSFVGSYERYSGGIGYVVYAALAVAVMRWFTGRTEALVAWILAGSTAVLGYGLVQMAGLDPVGWEGRFGDAVIAQFGNPNFVAGYLGIIFPLALWAALWSRWELPVRALAGVIALGSGVVIVGAGSAQGYLAAAVGGLIATVGAAAASMRRPAPLLAGVGTLLVGSAAVALAGSAGIGPAAAWWQSSTVRSRLLLWETATEMIRAEPFTGVGLDLYGRYYHAFRPVDEAVRRDLDRAADAAHNVVLNLAAGGGIPVSLAWLAVAGATIGLLVRAWRRTGTPRRRLVAALAGAYVAYHLQAFVSLDVPPLAVTHFVLIGAVGALGDAGVRRVGAASPVGAQHRRWWIAAGLAVPTIVILGLVLWADHLAGVADRVGADGDVERGRADVATAVSMAPWQPAYHFEQARVLAGAGELEAALESLDEVIERDPRDLAAWISRGRLLTALDRPLAAVESYREALRLAPTSPELTVEYAEALADVGQVGLARAELIELLRFVPDFEPARSLLEELDRSG